MSETDLTVKEGIVMDHVQAVPNEMRRSTEKVSVFQHTVALPREFHRIVLFMVFNLKFIANLYSPFSILHGS